MKKSTKFLLVAIFSLIWFFFLGNNAQTSAYMLGLKSWDNSIRNIQRVEETLKTDLPVVSFIFHTWDEYAYKTVADIPYELGTNKIYHITVAPDHFTAQEVADWRADAIYTNFFELVRDMRIKVVFRTMHEMNGWRYPRSSNPEAYKKARVRVRDLSRKAWLTTNEILFDMSVNARDMPTKDARPNQASVLQYCYPSQKTKLNCPTFEDYYPWDKYVDILGFTFYNRGKGNTNRLWQSPYEIINNVNWKTLDRLKTFGKPLFIDEVGTTAVWYDGAYNQQKSIEVFQAETARKDAWLDSLRYFLQNEPDIIWTIYFNVDLTYWLTNWMVWEADRSIFDPATGKMYEWWKRLLTKAFDNKVNYTRLYSAFNIHRTNRWTGKIFVWNAYGGRALKLLEQLSVFPTTDYTTAKKSVDAYLNAVNASTALSLTQKSIQRNVVKEALNIISQ